MEKIKLKEAIDGRTYVRNSIIDKFGVSRQQLHSWEKEKKPIPLKFFIHLKVMFPNLDEVQCPDYEQFFLDTPPYPTENNDGAPPVKKAIPDSRHYSGIDKSYNNQCVKVINISSNPNSHTYQENNLSIMVYL